MPLHVPAWGTTNEVGVLRTNVNNGGVNKFYFDPVTGEQNAAGNMRSGGAIYTTSGGQCGSGGLLKTFLMASRGLALELLGAAPAAPSVGQIYVYLIAGGAGPLGLQLALQDSSGAVTVLASF